MTSPEGTIPAQKQGGLFEDIIEVLYSPSVVFERTRAKKVGMYLLATTAVVAVIIFATKNLLIPWFDAQGELAIKLAAAKGKPLPEAAIASVRSSAKYTILIGAPLIMLIGPYLNATFLLIGAKLMKAPLTFAQAAMIATLGGVARIFGWLSMPVQALLLDSSTARSVSDLSVGPARFFDPMTTSPAVLTLLSNFDVFRIWQIVLISVGVSVVARVSKSTGALIAIVMVCIGAALQVIPSALF